MPNHWTYAPFQESDDLEQGDILVSNADLESVLSDVFVHFTDSKYSGFLVASQSCDLAIRGGSPKTPYINIAAIRPLKSVIHKFVNQTLTVRQDVFLPKSDQNKFKDLLSRIFNQNEQALGVFYLHADADSGIGEPCVAMLRVTVALRSEHYNILQRSRKGKLSPEFRAKLGWLLGNLYARPATTDWCEKDGGKMELDGLIAKYSNEVLDQIGLTWIDGSILDRAKKEGHDLKKITSEELERLKRETPILDQALNAVCNDLRKIIEINTKMASMPGGEDRPDKFHGLEKEVVDLILSKLRKRLANSGKFKGALRT